MSKTKVLKTYDKKSFDSVAKAVVYEIEPDGYEYRGQLEYTNARSRKTMEVLANLIDLLESKGIITEQEIKDSVL